MENKTKELINYRRDGEWSGYTLQERPDGLWRYENWSRIQGQTSGRVVILRPPAGWNVKDEADMDSCRENPAATQAEMLIHNGQEVRCLRRGYRVQ